MPLLRLPEPYSFELSTERFRAFGPDRANLWHDGALYRVVGGREVRLEAAPGGVSAEPFAGPEVERLLGTHWDLAAFAEFASADPVLALAAGRLAGFRPPLIPGPFEALVGFITAQQVSLHAAAAIGRRFVDAYGEPAAHAVAFPTEERVASLSEDDLFGVGFSRRKSEYVLGLARAGLDHAALAVLPDEEVKARLTALRGLGEWTADLYLARHLGRPHAWPAGDLVVRKAVSDLYAVAGDIREFGARFAPFENLACQYLLLDYRS